MQKQRLFRILSGADKEAVEGLAGKVMRQHRVTIVKEPQKTLTMIQMREPARQSLFYLGEVIVCEAIVEISGVRGMAVTMGVEPGKALHMAIIDAACNCGIFEDIPTLEALEAEQEARRQRENALHLKTMVQFHSMDAVHSEDVNSFSGSGGAET